jgi:ribonucleoside-triphosphate reductase
MADKCGQKCEVWSRVSGYMRPVSAWNSGKQEEYRDRVAYANQSSGAHDTVVVMEGDGTTNE